jgi:hypothetical protein
MITWRRDNEEGTALGLVLVFVTILGVWLGAVLLITQASTTGVQRMSLQNSNSSTAEAAKASVLAQLNYNAITNPALLTTTNCGVTIPVGYKGTFSCTPTLVTQPLTTTSMNTTSTGGTSPGIDNGIQFTGQWVVNSPIIVQSAQTSITPPAGDKTSSFVAPAIFIQNTGSGTTPYQPSAPKINSLSPSESSCVSPAGGETITIGGSNFVGVTSVTFGGASVPFQVYGTSSIVATIPNGSGTVPVAVIANGGTATGISFSYLSSSNCGGTSTPMVDSLSPISGPLAGGTAVSIVGSNFSKMSGNKSVGFDTNSSCSSSAYLPATGISYKDSSTITAITPAGASAASYYLCVKNGSSGTSLVSGSTSQKFTFLAPPSITMMTGGTGPIQGNTKVIITGSNLDKTTGITFGGKAALIDASSTSTSYTVYSPETSSPGIVDVVVTNNGGSTVAGQFTYVTCALQAGVTGVCIVSNNTQPTNNNGKIQEADSDSKTERHIRDYVNTCKDLANPITLPAGHYGDKEITILNTLMSSEKILEQDGVTVHEDCSKNDSSGTDKYSKTAKNDWTKNGKRTIEIRISRGVHVFHGDGATHNQLNLKKYSSDSSQYIIFKTDDSEATYNSKTGACSYAGGFQTAGTVNSLSKARGSQLVFEGKTSFKNTNATVTLCGPNTPGTHDAIIFPSQSDVDSCTSTYGSNCPINAAFTPASSTTAGFEVASTASPSIIDGTVKVNGGFLKIAQSSCKNVEIHGGVIANAVSISGPSTKCVFPVSGGSFTKQTYQIKIGGRTETVSINNLK